MQNKVITPKTYYVYTYALPDGTIFYVGKGTKGRIDEHEREASKGCMCRKCCIIREIWASNKPVQKRIVYETLDELEALERERTLVNLYACAQLANVKDNPYKEPEEIQELNRNVVSPEKVANPVQSTKPPVLIRGLDVSRFHPEQFRTDKLIDVQAVAGCLEVSYKTVMRLIEAKQLKASKVGRVWRIRKSDIAKYLWDRR